MHCQKPRWRKARSSPAAASRASGSRSSTLSGARRSRKARSKQKKPPLIQCSERGFSSNAEHAVVDVEAGHAELQPRAHDGHAWRAPRGPRWKPTSSPRSMSASPSE